MFFFLKKPFLVIITFIPLIHHQNFGALWVIRDVKVRNIKKSLHANPQKGCVISLKQVEFNANIMKN